MTDSLSCGGVLGSQIDGRGNAANPYPIAKRDRPFSYDGTVIRHRATGRVVAETREQVAAFFSGRQVPKRASRHMQLQKFRDEGSK